METNKTKSVVDVIANNKKRTCFYCNKNYTNENREFHFDSKKHGENFQLSNNEVSP